MIRGVAVLTGACLILLARCDGEIRLGSNSPDAGVASNDASIDDASSDANLCTIDVQCGGRRCNPATGECVDCLEDDDCHPGTPKCNPATARCVKCVNNADCPPGTPSCDPDSKACVKS